MLNVKLNCLWTDHDRLLVFFCFFFESKVKIPKVLLIESNGQKAPLHLNHGKAVYP